MGRIRTEENLVFVHVLRRKQQSTKRWEKPAETKSHFPSPGPERDSEALFTVPPPTPRPTPASWQQPSFVPRPLAAASSYSPAPEPEGPRPLAPEGGPGETSPTPTPGGDQSPQLVRGLSLPTHALLNLLGLSG